MPRRGTDVRYEGLTFSWCARQAQQVVRTRSVQKRVECYLLHHIQFRAATFYIRLATRA